MNVLVLILPLVFVSADVIQNKGDCGVQKVLPATSKRIVSGNETEYGEFPWVAALHYKRKSTGLDAGIYCSGFVINERFVVTAANCLHLKHEKLHQVWLGVRMISEVDTTDVDKVRKCDIEQQIAHEYYNPITSVNDIALLKLKGVIAYSDYIRPLCLPDSSAALPPSGTMLTVAGWGDIDRDGSVADLKLVINLPMYSHQDCEKYLGYPIRSDQICAEGEYLKGTCWGDSGGPLMQTLPSGIDRKWYAIGLISSVIGCGKHGQAIVHTRVSSYVNWIKEAVAEHGRLIDMVPHYEDRARSIPVARSPWHLKILLWRQIF